ncbi:hypothetical protein [Brevundimonas variabilis]|uniref:Uncharacterized protein n=1 Tax=Brevundimonas variabilis TaxID=74312 RepID=A0A7W9CIA3_9CAUL|nr:hypothetical protein [Brevundimonas variabilis]MBB5746169.1 hypothetical protein [Brevundimonas variabilis]
MSDKTLAAQRVADLINDAERAMDQAMAKASILVAELPQLQAQAGLNASWAQPAIVSVCAALSDMTTARGSLISAHRSLSVIQRKLGLVTTLLPGNDKASEGPIVPTSAFGDDRVVALRA